MICTGITAISGLFEDMLFCRIAYTGNIEIFGLFGGILN